MDPIIAAIRMKRYPEVLDAFLMAHDRSPDYVPTFHNVGFSYLKMDEPK